MKKKLKKIPEFKTEAEENKFWLKHDSSDYIDWANTKSVILPELKPSLKTISLRLPEAMLYEIKTLANKRDVPYQSLLKTFLADRIKEELVSRPKTRRKVQTTG